MDWIKKHPAQAALIAITLGLLASTYFLWSEVSQFSSTLQEPAISPPKEAKIPDTDLTAITALTAPNVSVAKWQFDESAEGSLFVADNYVKENGAIKKPEGGFFQKPIANAWLIKYGLSFLNKDIVAEDPDKDGFSNRIEWDGMDGLSHLSEKDAGQPVMGADGKPLPDDSTSPIDPQSHPPYYTRLRLAPLPNNSVPGIVSIPFRLKFMSYDINPRKPTDITAQINAIDRNRRTSFVAVGSDIPDTTFTVEKLEKKEAKDKDGIITDTSVLTIVNKVTKKTIPLPLGQIVDSPESYVVLRYLWVKPGDAPTPDMKLRKDDTFKLAGEENVTYKVVDIKAPGPQNNPPGEVTIELSHTGDKEPKAFKTIVLKTNDYLSTIIN